MSAKGYDSVRIFIADPRAPMRSALTLFLELEAGIEIVGEASDGNELLSCVAAARPDVLLVEWMLLTTSLADVLTVMHAQDSHPQVIVLSSRPEVRLVACAAGADGFVSKGDSPNQLLAMLRHLAQADACGRPMRRSEARNLGH